MSEPLFHCPQCKAPNRHANTIDECDRCRTVPSRLERTVVRADGKGFTIAFGVDHVTGPFCQVWKAPIGGQERPLVTIDNMGVDQRNKAILAALGEERAERVIRFLEGVRFRFRQSIARGIHRPNIDHETVTKLVILFGFAPEIGRDVFRVFD